MWFDGAGVLISETHCGCHVSKLQTQLPPVTMPTHNALCVCALDPFVHELDNGLCMWAMLLRFTKRDGEGRRTSVHVASCVCFRFSRMLLRYTILLLRVM